MEFLDNEILHGFVYTVCRCSGRHLHRAVAVAALSVFQQSDRCTLLYGYDGSMCASVRTAAAMTAPHRACPHIGGRPARVDCSARRQADRQKSLFTTG